MEEVRDKNAILQYCNIARSISGMMIDFFACAWNNQVTVDHPRRTTQSHGITCTNTITINGYFI